MQDNEATIETLEEEIKAAHRCLNTVLCDVISTNLFSAENPITWEKCSKLHQELRVSEKDKLETVKQ